MQEPLQEFTSGHAEKSNCSFIGFVVIPSVTFFPGHTIAGEDLSVALIKAMGVESHSMI